MSTANKILMGAAGAAGGGLSDDEFNRVSFLSHFDGANNGVNNAFDDSSASNHTITANGNVTQGSFGPFARPDGEWGVNFDGSGDILKTPSLTIGTGTITYECWLNFSTVAGNATIVSFNDDNSSRVSVYNSDGDLKIYSSANGGRTVKSSAFTTPNSWIKLLLVRASNTATVYLNGTSVGTGTMPENLTGVLAIGAYAGSEVFNGIISNVRLSDNARQSGNYTVETAPLASDSNTDLLTCQSNRFVDNSSNGHTITPTGNPAVTSFGPFLTSAVYDPAVNGASLSTPAAGDYLSFSNIGLDGHSGDFSIEAWVYPTSYASAVNPIYSQGSATSISDILDLSLNPSGQPLVNINQGTTTLGTTFVCPLNSWTFVQLKRTSGTLAILTNGVQRNTVSNTATIGSPNRGHVGTQSYDVGASNRSFYGFICDVRVSVVTRSVSLPTAPLAVIDSNTKLLLNMADGQAIDSAAQNNLTLAGNAKISTGQAKFGDTSMVFDGSGDYAFAPHNSIYNLSGDFTVELWAYISSNNTTSLIGKWANSNYAWIVQDLVTSLRFYTGNSGSVGTGYLFSWSRNLNQWYHIAITRSGTTIRAFQDGVLLGTATSSDNLISSASLNIGYNEDGGIQYFNGYLDEVRITNGVARYTSNFTAPTAAFPDKGQ